MARQAANGAGFYLYAVILGTQDRVYGPIGLEGSPVYTVGKGRVAAVVSDVPSGRIRPERRHLAAHQEVLRRLLEETTPLPMSFGIITKDKRALDRIIAQNQKGFHEQLLRLDGKVEMGLHVLWDVPNIFEYFVLTHPDLRAARDLFLGSHREPTQEEKIEVGRMFDRILQEDRESYSESVREALVPYCSEIKNNPPRNEREVINLACLVLREQQAVFESGIFEAARLFDHNFTFDYNGPWAPHNFVDMRIQF